MAATPITIKGIKLGDTHLTRDAEGLLAVSFSYQLISSLDKVLAKQEIGGYNGVKIQPSATTIAAFEAAIAAYTADVNGVLGLA